MIRKVNILLVVASINIKIIVFGSLSLLGEIMMLI
jgi:hypothetical protein